MSVATKLQIKPGATVATVGQPPEVDLEVPGANPVIADPSGADAVVVFAANRAELDQRRGPLRQAARRDALAWLAYPKAGQLGTDLNRESVAAALAGDAIRPVRQISIDDVWSALRFRPGNL
ncbi:MAG: hypothetical protein ACJ76X_11285 [Solirubrobacteraceae bacterium]